MFPGTKNKLIYSELLPLALANNNDGQGRHWGRSNKTRQSFERQLRALGLVRDPFECQVSIVVTRQLGKGQRLWDADSVGRGNAKQLIDSLVAVGWFFDDSPRYIEDCFFTQDSTRRSDGPATRIDIYAEQRTNHAD